MSSRYKQQALDYHASPKPGKVGTQITKPCITQHDLSLAYTPGVAEPCLAIARDPAEAYDYTSKGNLVAVISNGTAVLGLGDIGPAASKPVMEGKAVLFKAFADIDVFDIEVNATSPHFSPGSREQAQDSCSSAPLWSEKRSHSYGLSEEQAYGHED
jgi:malate dehydrogenase (oxaloacetate-decarboxylating)(NADP+)